MQSSQAWQRPRDATVQSSEGGGGGGAWKGKVLVGGARVTLLQGRGREERRGARQIHSWKRRLAARQHTGHSTHYGCGSSSSHDNSTSRDVLCSANHPSGGGSPKRVKDAVWQKVAPESQQPTPAGMGPTSPGRQAGGPCLRASCRVCGHPHACLPAH